MTRSRFGYGGCRRPRAACGLVALALGLVAGCDEGPNPVAPAAPTTSMRGGGAPPVSGALPPVSPAPVDSHRFEGDVVATSTGRAVVGATVVVEGHRAKTDTEGRFSIALDPEPMAGILDVVVSAPEFVTRNALLDWRAGGRSGVTIDIIEDRPPFALGFYRELARNGFEQPAALRPLRVWPGPAAPRFYIQLTDDRGAAISDQESETITRTIREVVPVLTGGRYTSVVVEQGPAERAPRQGWVRVQPLRAADGFCGRATVGATAGTIELVRTGCGCREGERITPGVVAHEVGHALGFWHVGGDSLMNAAARVCRSGATFSRAEVFHANLAYTRRRPNRDPDQDPKSGAFVSSLEESPPTVSCFRLE